MLQLRQIGLMEGRGRLRAEGERGEGAGCQMVQEVPIGQRVHVSRVWDGGEVGVLVRWNGLVGGNLYGQWAGAGGGVESIEVWT